MDLQLKVDSKGRICIPRELREEIGDVVTLKKTMEGFIIIPSKPVGFIEEFRKNHNFGPAENR